MLASIQTQIVQVQSLLGYDAAQPNPAPPRDIPRSAAGPEYLSEQEEEQLEAGLEQMREEGKRESEIIAAHWKRQQAEMEGKGVPIF